MPTSPVTSIDQAANAMREGGVIAYPTEGVYGLGCDPRNQTAFEHLFALKQRPPTQGVLLIGADFEQVRPWINLTAVPADVLDMVHATWPGPHTWIFPRAADVPPWVAGGHAGIALRVTAHAPAAELCRAWGGAIVSTSANPHGQPPAMNAVTVARYFPEGLAAIVDAPLGGLDKPTSIRDALTGAIIRA
ncbi:MAG TPA: Sua5/YciO/YrdC/YwlC family protein [Rhodanobacteraceae bacterium]|nr:Sua5/YciO/YrdC/YwlC family protein [Rhodanobacteraceae bacterium]